MTKNEKISTARSGLSASGCVDYVFFGSDIFRGSVYGEGHPLNIARVWPVIDLCRILNWLPDECYQPVEPASPEQLNLFHDMSYIRALQMAERDQALQDADMQRYRIGLDNNPIFADVYRRPATAAAASLMGADALFESRVKTAFNPSGGTHHGMPDKANGFCFVNDPALAILRLLLKGAQKVAYVDIDAHHPDGVQAHLSGDERVQLWSIHEKNRWPRTGQSGDNGEGFARNFTLERGAGNDELLRCVDQYILPEVARFAPEYIVLQAGCDGLEDDPQSGLVFSNIGYWQAAEKILGLNKPTLVLGGGGYNPISTARAWAGLWGLISGNDPYRCDLPETASRLLAGLEWSHRWARNKPRRWFERLYDDASS